MPPINRRIVAAMIPVTACGSATARSTQPSWSYFDDPQASIAIPRGWDVAVTDESRFELKAPVPGLAVTAVIVRRTDGDVSLPAAAVRTAKGLGGPSDFTLAKRADGSFDGEVDVTPGAVFAACAVEAWQDRMVLAVASRANLGSVDRDAYRAEGGIRLLCNIAASVRLFSP